MKDHHRQGLWMSGFCRGPGGSAVDEQTRQQSRQYTRTRMWSGRDGTAPLCALLCARALVSASNVRRGLWTHSRCGMWGRRGRWCRQGLWAHGMWGVWGRRGRWCRQGLWMQGRRGR